MKPKEIWYAEGAVTMLRATERAMKNDFGLLSIEAREDLMAALDAAAEDIESAISEAKETIPVVK